MNEQLIRSAETDEMRSISAFSTGTEHRPGCSRANIAGMCFFKSSSTFNPLSHRSRLRRFDDACQISASGQVGNRARVGLRLGGIRQHSADRARHKPGQL
jgi:hypothetical protein